jgi:TolB protein
MHYFTNKIALSLSLFIACFSSTKTFTYNTDTPSLEIQSDEKLVHRKLPCLMLVFSKDEALLNLAVQLKSDLEFTDQLEIDVKKTSANIQQKVFSKLFDNGYALALHLQSKNPQEVTFSIKDSQTQEVHYEETFPVNYAQLAHTSHSIANKAMPALIGESIPFVSSLAYCEQADRNRKGIYISDITGNYKREAVPAKRLNVAPRWHSVKPLLFFSQFSIDKARLISLDPITKKRHIVCAYNGLNMQPSFSADGGQVALCLSGNQANSEIYLYDQALCKTLKKRIYKPLTQNKGNNASPCLLSNGNLIFCSDFETGSPQIYHLDTSKQITTRLSQGSAYCAGPTYSENTDCIVYAKLCNNGFQLFSRNLSNKRSIEEQLTFDEGDKLDPAFSPCGKYVAFTLDKKNNETGRKIPQIAILNTSTKKVRVITTGNLPKSFPTWTSHTLYC